MNEPTNISEQSADAQLAAIALRRRAVWPMRPGAHDPMQAAAFAAELAQLGYRVRNVHAFTSLRRDEFLAGCAELRRLRGADVVHVPLFRHFPDELPNDTVYRAQRFLGTLGIDMFAGARFGADPVTQHQREDLWTASRIAAACAHPDSRVEWCDIEPVAEPEAHVLLERWALGLFYGNIPVKEMLWPEILAVLRLLGTSVDPACVTVKESAARLGALEWQSGRIVSRTPTDLLRVFACLRGQDVSLAENVSLKGLRFSKAQRRMVVAFLSSCSDLEADLLRYRRLWISLSRWLHPGDFATVYPRVARAFDDLRNNRIRSFESRLATARSEARVGIALERPGVLLRKLAWLLGQGESSPVVEALRRIGDDPQRAPLPLLLTMYSVLAHQGERVVINKAGGTYVIGPRRRNVGPDIVAALEDMILARLRGAWQFGSIWIDPRADRLVLPLQVRRASEGVPNLGRGSRLLLGDAPVMRLFVYWHQQRRTTDLDLSVLRLDDSFTPCGHVGWNSYGSGADIAHSGDVQSAPLGAAEFIDITLSAVAERYILPSVIRYAGEAFPELRDCHAGWMNREKVDASYATFDPATVAQRCLVQRNGRLWLPFMVDLREREVILADLYSAGARTIERNTHFPALAACVADLWQARPTYGLLARLYARANGTPMYPERSRAVATIGIDHDCTVNVLHRVGQGVTSFSS